MNKLNKNVKKLLKNSIFKSSCSIEYYKTRTVFMANCNIDLTPSQILSYKRSID